MKCYLFRDCGGSVWATPEAPIFASGGFQKRSEGRLLPYSLYWWVRERVVWVAEARDGFFDISLNEQAEVFPREMLYGATLDARTDNSEKSPATGKSDDPRKNAEGPACSSEFVVTEIHRDDLSTVYACKSSICAAATPTKGRWVAGRGGVNWSSGRYSFSSREEAEQHAKAEALLMATEASYQRLLKGD